MSIENIFNIGTSGLAANRLALEVTSENTANINTPGYSRQRVNFATGPTMILPTGSFGSGVRVQAIERAYDAMQQQQLISANSSNGNNQTVLSSLKAVEPSFNELANSGLGQAIQDYFAAWQDLSTNPAGVPERQAVIARAEVLIDNFHQVNSTLNQAITNADNSLPGLTADISDKAKNIAMLNGQIYQASLSGANPNELMDQRDFLVRELATKAGISFSTNAGNSDYIDIRLAGGNLLVQGESYAEVYANKTGVSPYDILITGTANPVPNRNPGADVNITSTVGGVGNSLGEIGGTLDIRNTTIPEYLRQLDELATNIANQVNAYHYTGYNLNSVPNTGLYFFGASTGASPVPTTTPPAYLATITGYSSTISLSNDLKTAGVFDPKKISAATAATSGSGDNRNAVTIAGLVTSPISFPTGIASINSYYNAYVGGVGINIQGAANSANQSSAYLRQLDSVWQSNSGVSLDEELTNLMKYQKAFQGSAKLITTATEMMDTVLGLVR